MMVGRPTFGVARSRSRPATGRPHRRPACRGPVRLGATRAGRRCATSACAVAAGRDRWAWPGYRATARRSWRGAVRACARPTAGSVFVDGRATSRVPRRREMMAARRRPHPGGSSRQPRAGPVGGRQPGARAPRRLPRRGAPGRAAHRRRTPATSSPAIAIKATAGRPRGHAVRAATSRRCCWRACCRATRGWSSCRSRPAALTWAPPSTFARELLARREAGAAILLVSEDLDELLALSDRLRRVVRGPRRGERERRDGADPGAAGAADGGSGAGGLTVALRRRRGAHRAAVLGGVRLGSAWPSLLAVLITLAASRPFLLVAAPTPSTAYSAVPRHCRSPRSSGLLEVLVSGHAASCSPAPRSRSPSGPAIWNIGAEGQLLAGAVAAAGIGHAGQALPAGWPGHPAHDRGRSARRRSVGADAGAPASAPGHRRGGDHAAAQPGGAAARGRAAPRTVARPQTGFPQSPPHRGRGHLPRPRRQVAPAPRASWSRWWSSSSPGTS